MSLTEPTPSPPLPDRYAPDVALPPYRYVPGLNAHPITHPDGHLRDTPEPTITLPAADGWSAYEPHRIACDLFHHAYWWEAHEAWEAIWHACERNGPEWLALRGLIQAAAALLKRHLGHEDAARVLLHKSCGHLRTASPDGRPVLAVDTAAVADALEACFGGTGKPPVLRLLP